MYPDAPFIKRNGEVNAWDNADFRKAVEATGKKQIIIAGIVTDVGFFVFSLYRDEPNLGIVTRYARRSWPCLCVRKATAFSRMRRLLDVARGELQMTPMLA